MIENFDQPIKLMKEHTKKSGKLLLVKKLAPQLTVYCIIHISKIITDSLL